MSSIKKTFINCNICGCKDFTIYYKDELGDSVPRMGYNFSPDSKKTFQIVRCRNCSLIYTNPMPDIAGLYEDVMDDIYLDAKPQRLRSAEKCISHILQFKSGGKLLDLGCATGCFLDVAARYFDVKGIELSEWAYSEAAKCHKLYNVPLSELHFHNDFDVITLFGVIEHFMDPAKEMKFVHDAMKPGGLLVLYTPDIGGWLPRLLGRQWWNIMGQHLYYFSRKTCADLLGMSGFQVVKVTTYPHYFKFSSIGDSLQRYTVGSLVKPVLNLPLLKNIMIPLYLSGEMMMFATKKT